MNNLNQFKAGDLVKIQVDCAGFPSEIFVRNAITKRWASIRFDGVGVVVDVFASSWTSGSHPQGKVIRVQILNTLYDFHVNAQDCLTLLKSGEGSDDI